MMLLFQFSLPLSRQSKMDFTQRCLLVSLLLSCLTAFAQTASQLEKLFASGVQALKAGQLDEAEKTFLQVLRQGGPAPFVHHNLGIVYQQRGAHDQAVWQFRAALRLQPAFGEAWLLSGYSLLALGKNTAAVRELERAVQLLPDQPQARLQLAKAYERLNHWLGVVDQYRALRAMKPQEAEYAYQLGRAYTKLMGWSYQRMAALNPNSARLHQSLGQDYLLQEKYDLALEAYQKAAAAAPQLPEIHLALALIYLEQKNIEAAAEAIARELKLEPESQKALAVQQKIAAAKGGKP